MSNASGVQELMKVLEDSGSLRYFFVEGGVTVHDKTDTPVRGMRVSTATFLDLRNRGVIEMTQREKGGYPHYANNHKSSVYKLAKKA